MKKLLFFILPMFVIACSHSGVNINMALDRAEYIMNEQPDSALIIMSSIDRHSVHGASDIARYSLLYSQALDKNYIDVDNDSLIRVAVDYYDNYGNNQQKALAYYYLGCVRYNAEDETLATEAIVMAENYALKTTDYYTCGLVYSCLGNLYCSQYSFDDALASYKKSEDFYSKAGRLENKGYMLEAQGRILALDGNVDDALVAYNKAMSIADEMGNKEQALLLNSKIAGLKLYNKYPVDAVKSSLRAIYKKYNIEKIPESDHFIWSSVYLKANEIDSARYLALAALDSNENITAHIKAGIFTLLIRIERQTGNYKKALEYSSQYIALHDSVTIREKDNLIQKTEQKYQNKLLKGSYEALRIKHRYQIIVIGLIAFIILAAAGIAIRLIMLHRRKMIEAKNKEIEAYMDMMNTLNENYSELQSKHEELEHSFAKDDEKEARFMRALEYRMEGLGKLLEYAYIYENKAGVFYNKFKEYIDSSRSNENSFSDLQYIVNKKYNGIIDYFKETYPMLTNDDLDFCSMICFGFSVNSIRIIYNHKNMDSVYNKRGRLHMKLGLSNKMRLETFIKHVMDELSGR